MQFLMHLLISGCSSIVVAKIEGKLQSMAIFPHGLFLTCDEMSDLPLQIKSDVDGNVSGGQQILASHQTKKIKVKKGDSFTPKNLDEDNTL